MGWISKLLNKTADEPEVPSPNTGFHDMQEHPVPILLASADPRVARELVHSAAKLTAHTYGIPLDWLSFEVVTIADDEKAFFQLQVLMHHWDEYLMAHSHAFERAVIKTISKEDVKVGRAVRSVLWRIAPDAGCPYDDMPEPDAWATEAIKQRAEVRDRINRVMYMQHHNALPAAMTFGDKKSPVQENVDTLPGANRSTMPATADSADSLSEHFESTHAAQLSGFVSTLSLAGDLPAKAKVDVATHGH